MDENNFATKSVKELQNYLKQRNVTFTGLRKPVLLDLCNAARDLGVEIDPDGLLEDREEILKDKLTTKQNIILPSPDTIQGHKDLSILPPFAIFDIYNYLLTFEQYDHSSLRHYQKMEAYGLFEDGYVLNVECCDLNAEYCAIKSNVKPRTNDVDPVSKLKYYRCWIVLSKTEESTGKGTVFSAYCTCKAGLDGGCRHTVATLFEVSDFIHDRKRDSVTSGPCLWVKRTTKTSEPVLVTELETRLTEALDESVVKPVEEVYQSIPGNVDLPKPEDFVEMVREVRPNACMLDVWEIREKTENQVHIDIKLPMQKTVEYWTAHLLHVCSDICKSEFIEYLTYLTDDIVKIEAGTKGQHNNPNWKKAREGILTSSNFKTVCHSTDCTKTCEALLKEQSFDDSNVPAPISYGRKYENKARDMFIKSHRFRHRKCKVDVPGLIISSSDPMLGTSSDGIVDCSICGPFLIEIKCMYSCQNFHPSPALLALKICEKNHDTLQIVKNHRYNYQIQGQMGITGIKKCVLVGFTNKGIYPVDVHFDEDMWNNMKTKLTNFYNNYFLNAILRQKKLL